MTDLLVSLRRRRRNDAPWNTSRSTATALPGCTARVMPRHWGVVSATREAQGCVASALGLRLILLMSGPVVWDQCDAISPVVDDG